MGTIKIAADKVWDLFQKEQSTLHTCMREIASNPDTEVVVMLTTVGKSGAEVADIIVNINNCQFYEEWCADEDDCFDTVSWIYEKFILDDEIDDESDDELEITEEMLEEMEINEREEEIDAALYDFFSVILDEELVDFEIERKGDCFKDCKEHFLEYMSLKWGYEIRRPMYLEYEDGETFFEEYPYEKLDFEDADNPIYLCE